MSKIPPYGYRSDPTNPKLLVPAPAEQVVIARMIELRSDGLTLRAVADQLTGEGLTCRDRGWDHKTIDRILKRERLRAAS